MIAEDQITSVRIVCLMLAAASVYCLTWPTPKIGNIFQRFPLPKNVARVIGWLGLAVAAGLGSLTIF